MLAAHAQAAVGRLGPRVAPRGNHTGGILTSGAGRRRGAGTLPVFSRGNQTRCTAPRPVASGCWNNISRSASQLAGTAFPRPPHLPHGVASSRRRGSSNSTGIVNLSCCPPCSGLCAAIAADRATAGQPRAPPMESPGAPESSTRFARPQPLRQALQKWLPRDFAGLLESASAGAGSARLLLDSSLPWTLPALRSLNRSDTATSPTDGDGGRRGRRACSTTRTPRSARSSAPAAAAPAAAAEPAAGSARGRRGRSTCTLIAPVIALAHCVRQQGLARRGAARARRRSIRGAGRRDRDQAYSSQGEALALVENNGVAPLRAGAGGPAPAGPDARALGASRRA